MVNNDENHEEQCKPVHHSSSLVKSLDVIALKVLKVLTWMDNCAFLTCAAISDNSISPGSKVASLSVQRKHVMLGKENEEGLYKLQRRASLEECSSGCATQWHKAMLFMLHGRVYSLSISLSLSPSLSLFLNGCWGAGVNLLLKHAWQADLAELLMLVWLLHAIRFDNATLSFSLPPLWDFQDFIIPLDPWIIQLHLKVYIKMNFVYVFVSHPFSPLHPSQSYKG